ncbi:MAG: transporter substrate-binding protein [Microbacteriaceae bacterium]|nr:transporter substrate-binding protein [Microbacteriaceae bacterium]
MRHIPLVAVLSLVAVALSGCAATPDDAASPGLSVVTSTNVYGSIAESIGGDLVTVTSIITSAAQDPHSYEASAQDRLALSKADLVIENGGGYDPFIDTLLGEASDTPVLIATEVSGLLDAAGGEHEHDAHSDAESGDSEAGSAQDGHDHIEGFNEHVWYSPHGMLHVAHELAQQLGELDPHNAAAFEANYELFAADIAAIEAKAEAMHPVTASRGVAVPEPVPVFLLAAAGPTNETPAEFSEAIEEGTDVAPAALRETLALFGSGSVALLAYNGQTASPETERVRARAEENGVPVVEFTETMPEGADYVGWMTDNIGTISQALGE